MLPPLNTILSELFQAHSVKAVLRDDDVFLPESGRTVSATIVKETTLAQGMSVQLDVRFTVAPGLTIVESFAGIGEDKEKATGNAVQSFAANSFHVFLTAFLRSENDHAAQETWNVGGKQRTVTAGNVGLRGKPPVEGEALVAWTEYFREQLGTQNLGPETHWIRVYYAQNQSKAVVCEVMRDNETWDEMQSVMSAFPWPLSEDFYSMRLFLVVVGDDSILTPKRAVAILAETVEANSDATDDEIYAAMADAKIPEAMAHRAFLFTQIAWGRLLLVRMGITFSPDYHYFDSGGNVAESGHVAEEPFLRLPFPSAASMSALQHTSVS